MAYYAERTRLEKRLTDAGVKFVANRNRDSLTSDTEKEDTLDEGLRVASNRIDAALIGQIDVAIARSQACDVLSDICVDLAAAYCAGLGGRTVPESLKDSKTDAESLLQRFEAGFRVPGLTYPTPINTEYTHRLPRWG